MIRAPYIYTCIYIYTHVKTLGEREACTCVWEFLWSMVSAPNSLYEALDPVVVEVLCLCNSYIAPLEEFSDGRLAQRLMQDAERCDDWNEHWSCAEVYPETSCSFMACA